MLDSKLEKLANTILESNDDIKVDKEIIVYGLTSAITQGVSIIIAVMLGVIFKLLLESLVFLISFSLLRMYAGGYHCSKAIQCYFISTGIFITVLTIIKFTPMECVLPICIFILVVSVPMILKLAPIGTESRPLDKVEQHHYRQKTTFHLFIQCSIIPILFFLRLHTLAFTMCIGIMIVTGVVIMQNLIKK